MYPGHWPDNLPNSVGEILQHDILQAHIIRHNTDPEFPVFSEGSNDTDSGLLPVPHFPSMLQHQARCRVNQVRHFRHKAAVATSGEAREGRLVRGSTGHELLLVVVQNTEFVVECSFIAGQKTLERGRVTKATDHYTRNTHSITDNKETSALGNCL